MANYFIFSPNGFKFQKLPTIFKVSQQLRIPEMNSLSSRSRVGCAKCLQMRFLQTTLVEKQCNYMLVSVWKQSNDFTLLVINLTFHLEWTNVHLHETFALVFSSVAVLKAQQDQFKWLAALWSLR